jgi:hypothetical protein
MGVEQVCRLEVLLGTGSGRKDPEDTEEDRELNILKKMLLSTPESSKSKDHHSKCKS